MLGMPRKQQSKPPQPSKLSKLSMNKLTNYFREALYELRKVTWPTKKQTVNYSIVVIAITIGMAIFFALLDYFFTWLLSVIV